MRILQLIDSLNPGGAEKMAVNYANSLAEVIDFSALITTRSEGELKAQISKNVSYLFLNKKITLDLFAILKLYFFIKKNKIEIIHAHSSSFFLATLMKILMPKLYLIWHDHYGNSDFLEQRNLKVIQKCSKYFNLIIAVNEKLQKWAVTNLQSKKVIYLPNFIIDNPENSFQKLTTLKGNSSQRILCLANLRSQKNHEMLLEVAQKIKKDFPDWTFHLVGKDFQDAYSNKIKTNIIKYNLQNNVYIYGTCTDIKHIIKQSNIGILTSKSEGLPLAILEYGLYELPVILTSVGEIPKLITTNDLGFLVPTNDTNEFYKALVNMIKNDKLREVMQANYSTFVKNNFSDKAILEKYLKNIT